MSTAASTPESDVRPPNERVSIRKKRAIKYVAGHVQDEHELIVSRLGRKIVRVTVGAEKEVVNIHEALLCADSSYFKERLQKNRKPIEGEYRICHEDLRVDAEEIVFCHTCGGNLHYQCMRKWEEQNTPEDSEDEFQPADAGS